MRKKKNRLSESQTHTAIKESVKRVLRASQGKTSLKDFMKLWYDNDQSCVDALNKLQDERWLHSMGWEQVFHEGYGDGVYSPAEGCVAVFDEDDLPDFHSYHLCRYNPKTWVSVENDGWDDVYDGNNGSGSDVEEFQESHTEQTPFEEFDNNTICISDLHLVYQGARIDYIVHNNGKIEFWAGNPDTDKHAEELLIDKNTARAFMQTIENEML